MNLSKLLTTSLLVHVLLDTVGTNRASATVLKQDEDAHLRGGKNLLRGRRLQGSTRFMTSSSSSGTENTFLVKFKDHEQFEAIDAQLQSDPRQIMSLPEDDVEVMTIESEEELQYWEERDDVDYVEPDYPVFPLAEQTPYGIDAVKALSVSDESVSNRKVCIIDSGYDIHHPDLQSSSGIVTGMNYVPGSYWYTDEIGHGTHVAGTIAAISGNDQGVVGVNRNGQVRLHISKVFGGDGSSSTLATIMLAFEDCVSSGANVINMSLGWDGYSESFHRVISRTVNQSVLLVAAAGNDGTNKYSFPASYPSVMSVAAVDIDNAKASFSQFNDQVDIAAPGDGVLSTIPGGGYAWKSGTSMATPHVAGVAALVWSHFPTNTAQQIRQALESSAQDLGASGRDDYFGHGLVRADLAYNVLFNSQEPEDTVTEPVIDEPTSNIKLDKIEVIDCSGIPEGPHMLYNVEEGQSVKCNSYDPSIYRYTNGQLRQYPTYKIFTSWSKDGAYEMIDCTGIPQGPYMIHNVNEGQSVKCKASESTIYRYTNGQLRWYTDYAIYKSWNKDLSYEVIDCLGIPQGPQMTQVQSVKCNAYYPSIYRYFNDLLRHYPNFFVFKSWNYSGSYDVIDCSGIPEGPHMLYNVEEGQSVKCSSDPAIYRYTNGQLRWYRSEISFTSWSKDGSYDMIKCSGIPHGPDMVHNVKEGQSVKCDESKPSIYRYTNAQLRWYPGRAAFNSWNKDGAYEVIDCLGIPEGPQMTEVKDVKCGTSTSVYRYTDNELRHYPSLAILTSWN